MEYGEGGTAGPAAASSAAGTNGITVPASESSNHSLISVPGSGCIRNEIGKRKFFLFLFSVSDPYSFDTDQDPVLG